MKVSTRSGMIVSGHGRYQAAWILRCPVPVDFQDYASEEEELADLTADNRIAELAENDEEMLAEILAEINLSDLPIEMTGYTDEDLNNIIGSIIGEDEEEPDPPYQDEEYQQLHPPMSKSGDLWMLGPHRLICGDSTDKETVAKLLNGEKADMVFTDPPYNVAFNGRSGSFDVIENDDLSESEFDTFIGNITDIIKWINPPSYYIWCNWKFYGTLQKNLPFKACIVWAKNVFGLGKGYRHQHEFCLFNGAIDEHITNESDLWEIAKDTNYVHPTQKPTALCGRALRNHKDAKIIVDLFGGSGSTLSACDHHGRICYTMEIDPVYCDVIISRYVTQTGNLGVTCIRDGKELSYMDLVRGWAKATGEEERINAMKIPVVVTKKIGEATMTAQDAL